jgi:predicted dehydrogenase
MSELGIAIVGLGIGAEHARAYARMPECTVRWLHDLDPDRADRLAEELGQGRRAADFESIIADPDVDVVSIATYDDDHWAQTVDALRAGKHVFVEKPMCRSLAELHEIAEAWRAAGHPHVASNLPLRGASLYQGLRQAIEAGELGTIYAFDGDYLYGRLHKLTDGWRGDVDDYSVMQGGGVHLVDLMLWLTGERPVSVSAAGNRVCTAGTAFRYDDFVAATFRFESGLIGRITANFGCVHRHQHVVRVFGTAATFIYDDLGPRIHPSRDPSVTAIPVDLSPLPLVKGVLIPPFVAAIAAGDDGRARTRHDFDVISACFAADAAAKADSRVEVEYV